VRKLFREKVTTSSADYPDAIIGLDISLTCTGLCAVNRLGAKAAYTDTFRTNVRTGTDWHRQNLILNGVVEVVRDFKGDFKSVFIENYTLGRMSGKNYTRVELHGMMRRGLQEIGCEVYLVAPGTLKKWVTGSGNADKEHMSIASLARWGVVMDTDDETDAHALVKYGSAMLWDNLPLVAERLCVTLSDMV
jgi:crossover junction endodeoxyribonuclease RuvC